jgi:hypothetical protein
MGGCFSSSSHEQGREQNEITLKGTAQQRADLIKRSMRDGVGLPAKSEPSLRHGLSGAGSFYSKERVPSKPALKSPGSMRRAKVKIRRDDSFKPQICMLTHDESPMPNRLLPWTHRLTWTCQMTQQTWKRAQTSSPSALVKRTPRLTPPSPLP